MKPALPPPLASLWLHWVLAHATVVGTVHALVVIVADWTWDIPQASPLLMLVKIPGALGLLFLVGYAQQVVLRRWIAYVDYWALMMPAKVLLGAILAFMPTWFFSSLLQVALQDNPGIARYVSSIEILPTLAALCFGVGLSLLELPYLCRTQRGAWLWIAASAVGITLGFYLEKLDFKEYTAGRLTLFSTIGRNSLLWTLIGAVYGAITGGALVVLLRGHARHPVRIVGDGPQPRP